MRPDIFKMLCELPSEPRLHGNGMIQWYVNSTQRLHFSPGTALRVPAHNALRHDHTWGMDSTILGGTLNHQIFEVDDSDDPTHDVIQFVPDVRKSAKGHVIQSGRLRMTHAMNMVAGSLYWQSAGTFHDSYPIGNTTTLITKRGSEGVDRLARIICPHGKEPTDAFDPKHSPPVDELMNWVFKAPIATPELEQVLINAIQRGLNDGS